MRWTEQALCQEVDPEIFYPDKGGTTRYAKSVCAHCEVTLQCLRQAVENNELWGVWGGKSERERRHLTVADVDAMTAPVIDFTPEPEPTVRQVCGTNAGYLLHNRHREPPCEACLDAHSAYEVARRPRRRELERQSRAKGAA